jgi:hypothetical protein
MTWQIWLNLVLGIAVVATAFIGLDGTALMATLLVLGVSIVAVSFSEFWNIAGSNTAV